MRSQCFFIHGHGFAEDEDAFLVVARATTAGCATCGGRRRNCRTWRNEFMVTEMNQFDNFEQGLRRGDVAMYGRAATWREVRWDATAMMWRRLRNPSSDVVTHLLLA
mmetsp:Transcript_28011/g.70923  ORF Transcript_28011/g.70923 Transcript_28011/m.70923 type:complete len:107 (-) Transcript_28011:3591-3911(-)